MAERRIREPNAPPGIEDRRRGRQNERIALFKNRVSAARAVRDEWQQRYELDRLYDLFLGDISGYVLFGDESSNDDFYVNKILPTIKTIMPSLFLQNPTFIVRSKVENMDPSTVMKAKMGEAAMFSIAEQEHHLEFSVRLAILQSFFSIGVLKSTYQPMMIKNPRAGDIMYRRDSSGFPILDDMDMAVEMKDENGVTMIEPDRIMDDETYRWDWVNGDKMLLPDAGPAHLRWPWIAEEVTVLLDDARDDERFPASLRTQLQPNTSGYDDEYSESGYSEVFGSGSDVNNRNRDRYLTYIEMYDFKRRRQTIWCDGQTFSDTQFLLDRDTPDGIETHPYSMLLGYIPIIGRKTCPWPLPYIFTWLPLQREHNIRRRQISNGAKRTARKIFYEEDTFADSDQAVAALQSSEDMQAVKIMSLDRPPRPMEDPPLPQNIVQDLYLLESDWQFVTGVSGARMGSRNRGDNSVYAEKTQVASGEIRDLDMRHSVNVWLTNAGKKMLRLLKATLTMGMYVRMRGTSDSHFLNYVQRVYGPQMAQNISQFPNLRAQFDQEFGNDRWLYLRGEELDFEADVSIAPGSARPRNMETEKQDFFQILQLLGSVPILTQSRALLNRVADMFEFFDVSMIDEILAASQKAMMIEQMRAGRFQGGAGGGQLHGSFHSQEQAALGGGANVSSFRRNYVGG
jgi:hypothetical protein